ncbi:hypothetical protein J4Q44_G00209860, partial [Coregonus suidteri]
VHFVSDGPATQYRSKNNLYRLSTLPFEIGFQRVTWNYLETGHGKGPADWVGAAVKRRADGIVAQGEDLPNGKTVFEELSKDQSAIKLLYISEEEIEHMEALPPDHLETIRGTMNIHQIVTDSPGEITWRILSCFCSFPHHCSYFSPQTVTG